MPAKRDSKGRFVKTKTSFITAREMRKKAAPGTIKSLRRAAAYLRGVARRLVRRSRRPSQPGKPPHTRNGALKRSIFYVVEGRGIFSRALIGPTFTGVGRIMLAHEYGDRFQGRNYPERPLMAPALNKMRDRLPSYWRGSITN